jgi:murein DD-endopeptidase MepM/ murein hydrolase activator NlpD
MNAARAAIRELRCFFSDRRRLIQNVFAPMFVWASVLLVLDQKLPFPRPAERVLYAPKGWPGDWKLLIRRAEPREEPVRPEDAEAGGAVGGESYQVLPLSMMSYRVKPGDTLERIAYRFGMELDTLSSLNRPGGKGVHYLVTGEEIQIPNQDGIYLGVNGDFDALCAKYNLAAEDVLAANSISKKDLAPGMRIFFPGAKHAGYELSLSYGVAIANPVHGGWVSSPFGYRTDPFTGSKTRHRGIDLAASQGAPVRSASDGRVVDCGFHDVLGNFIVVRAPLGFQYIYGHLSAILVRNGTRVSQGSLIGRVGSTGYATGPHLHFEVWKDGVPQNPRKYMPGIR